MVFTIIDTENVKIPDGLLDDNGIIKLRPASFYQSIDPIALRLWCHQHARYGIVTEELIALLKDILQHYFSPIEIGAGHGDLCYHLGIQGTDSYMQLLPEVSAIYKASGQPAMSYGKHVRRMEAIDAVRKLKPDIVIGSWITHWVSPKKPPKDGVGSIYGVNMDKLMSFGIPYVTIGNTAIHNKNPLYQRYFHKIASDPCLISRSSLIGTDFIAFVLPERIKNNGTP